VSRHTDVECQIIVAVSLLPLAGAVIGALGVSRIVLVDIAFIGAGVLDLGITIALGVSRIVLVDIAFIGAGVLDLGITVSLLEGRSCLCARSLFTRDMGFSFTEKISMNLVCASP
jgi:hypothetical protein